MRQRLAQRSDVGVHHTVDGNSMIALPALRAEPVRRISPLAFCIFFAVCAIPIVVAKIPPLLDYPSHLARIYIITHPTDALLAQYFSVGWKLTPAMAVDLVMPPLTNLVGIFSAGKLFLLLTILLITSGTFALNYALHRAWAGAAASFLFVYNGVLWDGLLPYVFSIGVALWATAAWIACRNWSWPIRVVLSALAVTALFLSHLAGVGLYLLAIFCYEVSRLQWTRLKWRQVARDGVIMLAPFLVTLPLLWASGTSSHDAPVRWGSLAMKWIGPYLAVRSANLLVDALFAGFVVVAVVALVYFKWLEIGRVAWLFVILCTLSYLLIPGEFFDGSEIDIRLPVAFVFFCIGLVHWRIEGSKRTLIFNAAILAVLAIRVGGVAQAWQRYGAIVSEYEASLADIAPGSRVLVVSDLNADWRGSGNRVTLAMDQDAIGHMPALATIERSSLVSEVFAEPGNKIYPEVSFRSPYRDAVPRQVVPVERLDSVLEDAYDYVYVQYAGPGTQPQLPETTLLYEGSSFQLYKLNTAAQ